jgi:hypothetical protein
MAHEWYDATTPADTDNAGDGAEEIRELKTGLNTLFAKEHYFTHPVTPAPATPADGIHVPKSARIYPVATRTSVAAADKYTGLLIWETGPSTFAYWNGTTWVTINSGSGDYTIEINADQTVEINHGYITDKPVSRLELLLPTTAVVGQSFKVYGKGSTGWRITQNTDQLIHFANQATTTGTSGFIQNTGQYDAISLVCIVTDTEWEIYNSVGNIFLV